MKRFKKKRRRYPYPTDELYVYYNHPSGQEEVYLRRPIGNKGYYLLKIAGVGKDKEGNLGLWLLGEAGIYEDKKLHRASPDEIKGVTKWVSPDKMKKAMKEAEARYWRTIENQDEET